MTKFVGVSDLSNFISGYGVVNCIMGMIDYIEDDYRRWGNFDKCARVASHNQTGVIELMPVADDNLYSFKYVNGHPQNFTHDLPTVMAFGALSDVKTGYPLLLSELTLTTAIRTAATSALAAKYMARPGSKTMAIIGNGAQSDFQVLAFHKALGVDTFRCYDTDGFATSKLIENISNFFDVEMIRCNSAAEACEGADIVTTVTADKKHATILTPDMISPGMHINGVGGDCPGKTEVHKDVLINSTIFVEYEKQSRVEGDVQQLPENHPVTEIWRLISGNKTGRSSDAEITFFDSVGFALEDYSALRYLYDMTKKNKMGVTIDLIPENDSPKDLFPFTHRGRKGRSLKRVA